jgi:hypothetical protein
MSKLEQMGRLFGEHVAKPGLEFIRRRVEQFELEIAGIENLKILHARPYLLAANHIKPEGKVSNQSGLAPDALIFERLIAEETGRQLRIIAKCDDGWWADNLYKYFQKFVGQPFGKGMYEALGFIPIKKNPGSFNRDFLKAVARVVEQGEPILIFPEGNWREEYDPEAKLESGAATIALKYNLPIVPAYIKGGKSWRSGEKASVIFGPHFEAQSNNKEKITEQIRLAIKDLFVQSHFNSNNA